MAKKKNDPSPIVGAAILGIMAIGAILLAILAILAYAAMFAYILLPILFLIFFLVAFYKYKRKDLPFVEQNFYLTENEVNARNKALRDYSWAKDKLEECDRIIQEKGLRRNADGRLSQRSYAGQDVQGAIDNAKSIKEEALESYTYYEELVQSRYKGARKHFSRSWAFAFSFVVLLIGFAFHYVTYEPKEDNNTATTEIVTKADSSTQDIIAESADDSNTKDDPILDQTMSSILPAILEMAIMYFIVFSIAYIVFSVKHKKPQK